MEKKLHLQTIAVVFFLLLFTLTSTVFAQYPAYRSKASGVWGDVSTWEYQVDAASAWVAAVAKPGNGAYVTILAGHTVSTGSETCSGLNIQAGGTFHPSTTAATTFTINNPANNVDENFIVNNGTILSGTVGSNTYGSLRIHTHQRIKKLTLTGSGTTYLGRIYARGDNSNALEVIIDKNVILNESIGASGFTAMDVLVVNRRATDDVTFTINAGKSVVSQGTAAPFHSSGGASTVAGKYTYNINGVLDCSSNVNAAFLTPNEAGSLVTLNVSGKLILGHRFESIGNTADETLGLEDERVKINVLAGGEIDLSSTDPTRLKLGEVFFNLSGTGKVVKSIAPDTEVEFPIGSNTYSPVWVKNTGIVPVSYTVNVKNSFDYPGINLDKSVNKQWHVSTVANNDPTTLRFGWLVADQGAEFIPLSATSIFNRDNVNNVWIEQSATSTQSAPVFMAQGNYTSLGLFGVGQSGTLPLNLLTFEEINSSDFQNTVKLRWVTSNEQEISHFEIERSIDGIVFLKVGEALPKVGAGTKDYFFTDEKFNDVVYYRLKTVDTDGSTSMSKILSVGKANQSANISVYPNPVTGTLNISHTKVKGYSFAKIYNLNGQVLSFKLLNTNAIGTTIDMSGFKSGNYILELYDGTQKSFIKLMKM
jgi:hypothetical protein